MKSRLVLILVMVLSVAGAGFLLWRGSDRNAVATGPQTQILSAAAALPVSTLLRPQDIAWRTVAPDSIPPHAIERVVDGKGEPLPPSASDAGADQASAGKDVASANDVLGAVVRRAIDAGEPILTEDIVKPGDRGFLAAVLSPGMRAISIGVDAVSGTSGLIYPGDRVDLLLTQSFKGDDVAQGHRSVAEIVAQDLRVLAIDQRLQPARTDPATDASVARTVALEVSPRQSAQISVAAELGKLSLTLRSLMAGDGTSAQGTPIPAVTAPVWANDVTTVSPGSDRNRAKPDAPPAPTVVVIHGVKADTAPAH